jgi:hypothetical protein
MTEISDRPTEQRYTLGKRRTCHCYRPYYDRWFACDEATEEACLQAATRGTGRTVLHRDARELIESPIDRNNCKGV